MPAKPSGKRAAKSSRKLPPKRAKRTSAKAAPAKRATAKRPAASRVAGKGTATKGAMAKPAATMRAHQDGKGAGDWREATLARMRSLIMEADPGMVEEQKWRKPSNAMVGVPVWSHHGMVCTGETYKDKLKLTFARGASLDDPTGLLNAGLEGGTRRAIDIGEGETPDAEAFKALVRDAVARNLENASRNGSQAKA